jgi:hypothetical protein
LYHVSSCKQHNFSFGTLLRQSSFGIFMRQSFFGTVWVALAFFFFIAALQRYQKNLREAHSVLQINHTFLRCSLICLPKKFAEMQLWNGLKNLLISNFRTGTSFLVQLCSFLSPNRPSHSNSLLCPKLYTQFSRKQAQNARFVWLKTTSVLRLFSWKLGL